MQSCKKDEIPVTRVPGYLKAMLPYVNGETVRFSRNGGSPFPAQVSVEFNLATVSSCQGCDDIRKIETMDARLTVNGRAFINFGVDNRPNVFLSIMSPDNFFTSGSSFDFLVEDGVSQFLCNAPAQTCLASVVLNGQTFYNVLEISHGIAPDAITQAYYTIQDGLVGFKYGSGVTYSLVD